MTTTQENSEMQNYYNRMSDLGKAIDANQAECHKCGSVAVFWAKTVNDKNILMDTPVNEKGGWQVTRGFGTTLHAKSYDWASLKTIPKNERRTAHFDTCPKRVPRTLRNSA